MNAEQTAAMIIGLYRQYGHEDYIGEPVSQLEHMCQCAELAKLQGYGEEVIVAAFLHDIGHLCAHMMPQEVAQMGGYGVVDHEKLGGDFLRRHGFPERVARLVESHVEAKRYLTFQYPSYYNQLSEASKQTLLHQGGPMNFEEATSFEAAPDFDLFIKLRQWDEQAKLAAQPLPDLEYYAQMMARLLRKNEYQ